MDPHDDLFDDDELDDAIEAYCVRCREMVTLEQAVAVWTRRGVPATRGECALCGGTVFRMGKTSAHLRLERPSAVQVATNTRVRLPQETIYIAFPAEDEAFAEQLAADLQKIGIACWLHEHHPPDVNWAGKAHPALQECVRMIVVQSSGALGIESVTAAWQFFREKRKPIVIAQIGASEPPDALRRTPRFDFTTDYRTAFRQMLQALHT